MKRLQKLRTHCLATCSSPIRVYCQHIGWFGIGPSLKARSTLALSHPAICHQLQRRQLLHRRQHHPRRSPRQEVPKIRSAASLDKQHLVRLPRLVSSVPLLSDLRRPPRPLANQPSARLHQLQPLVSLHSQRVLHRSASRQNLLLALLLLSDRPAHSVSLQDLQRLPLDKPQSLLWVLPQGPHSQHLVRLRSQHSALPLHLPLVRLEGSERHHRGARRRRRRRHQQATHSHLKQARLVSPSSDSQLRDQGQVSRALAVPTVVSLVLQVLDSRSLHLAHHQMQLLLHLV